MQLSLVRKGRAARRWLPSWQVGRMVTKTAAQSLPASPHTPSPRPPGPGLVSTPSQGFSLPAPRVCSMLLRLHPAYGSLGSVKFLLLRQQLWGGAESLHSHQARATLSSKAGAPGGLNIGNITPEASLPPQVPQACALPLQPSGLSVSSPPRAPGPKRLKA